MIVEFFENSGMSFSAEHEAENAANKYGFCISHSAKIGSTRAVFTRDKAYSFSNKEWLTVCEDQKDVADGMLYYPTKDARFGRCILVIRNKEKEKFPTEEQIIQLNFCFPPLE